ncbi:efflux transporter outer membrane subunit [Methylobacterium sp. JK268]
MAWTATRRRKGAAAFAGGAGLLALGACAVGPDFVPPAPPAVSRFTKEPLGDPSPGDQGSKGAVRQHFVAGADIPGQWWTLFGSKALNRLVDEALANNPTLEAAQASLRIARQNAEAQIGSLYPSISATPQGSLQKTTESFSPPLNNPNQYLYSLYTPQLQITYTPDVFGGERRQIESLQAQAENQRFQLEATYLTLTSNVVLAAIQEASIRAQIDATKRVIQAQTEVLNLYNKQLSLGQIAGADVVQQQAALAVSLQLLPPLEKQLAQQRNLLTALVGRLPSQEITETFTLASLKVPRKLPVSLPSRLIQQRPDVKAAEALVHAASASVGVAVAARLPQFNLSVTGGASAVKLAQVLDPRSSFFTIVGSVTQPLFDAGTLFHKQRAAEETLAQAQAQYRSTVLTAFQNVADSLRALQTDVRAVAAAHAAEQATQQSLTLVRRQFTLGAVSSVTVLLAEQAYLQALVTASQARANQYSDTAALFQALGGGWWNRSDVAPVSPEKEIFKFI